EGGSKRQRRGRRERNSSLAKRDVARRNVQQVNPEFFKCFQHPPNCGPSRLELLPLFGLPVGPDLCRKFGAFVEVCPRKIKDEGPLDDGHFNDTQLLVMSE